MTFGMFAGRRRLLPSCRQPALGASVVAGLGLVAGVCELLTWRRAAFSPCSEWPAFSRSRTAERGTGPTLDADAADVWLSDVRSPNDGGACPSSSSSSSAVTFVNGDTRWMSRPGPLSAAAGAAGSAAWSGGAAGAAAAGAVAPSDTPTEAGARGGAAAMALAVAAPGLRVVTCFAAVILVRRVSGCESLLRGCAARASRGFCTECCRPSGSWGLAGDKLTGGASTAGTPPCCAAEASASAATSAAGLEGDMSS